MPLDLYQPLCISHVLLPSHYTPFYVTAQRKYSKHDSANPYLYPPPLPPFPKQGLPFICLPLPPPIPQAGATPSELPIHVCDVAFWIIENASSCTIGNTNS